MDRKSKLFLAIYIPLVLLAFLLTVDVVNPISFPSLRMTALNLLPMVGFIVLGGGGLVGGAVLYMMDEPRKGKRFALSGVFVAIAAGLIVCNLFRDPLLRRVGAKQGRRAASELMQSNETYRRPSFNMRERFPHLVMFLKGERDERVVQSAFMEAYRRSLLERAPDCVDLEALGERGHAHGYEQGAAAGRNAARRGESGRPPALAEEFLDRLEMNHFNEYVNGYRAGYHEGWLAAVEGDGAWTRNPRGNGP